VVKVVTLRRGATDVQAGCFGLSTPLAQALLGATVGDEVVLPVPPHPSRQLRVVDIKTVN